ncbi:hypothetical protein AU14_04830 [Marinobacter similis]|uniref:Uncharacterized protein n=1 Tax=Marinobacter similis TaxID=1420916 RepID=W5YU62_9GAMM|nr:hypothetical protein AU14_04830 [Marinobacter similis]
MAGACSVSGIREWMLAIRLWQGDGSWPIRKIDDWQGA